MTAISAETKTVLILDQRSVTLYSQFAAFYKQILATPDFLSGISHFFRFVGAIMMKSQFQSVILIVLTIGVCVSDLSAQTKRFSDYERWLYRVSTMGMEKEIGYLEHGRRVITNGAMHGGATIAGAAGGFAVGGPVGGMIGGVGGAAATGAVDEHFDLVESQKVFGNVSRADADQLRRELSDIAAKNPEVANAVQSLKSKIVSGMKVLDLRQIAFTELVSVGSQLAKDVNQLEDVVAIERSRLDEVLQREKTTLATLNRHSNLLRGAQEQLDYLSNRQLQFQAETNDRFAELEDRLSSTQAAMDRQTRRMDILEETYPRWNPQHQAMVLGITAFQELRLGKNGNNSLSLRAFRMAHAIDPREPANVYGIAVCLRRSGEKQDAEILLARGVYFERHRPLPKWYLSMLETFQNPDRMWIEALREDPLLGVHAPGTLRLPSTDPTAALKNDANK